MKHTRWAKCVECGKWTGRTINADDEREFAWRMSLPHIHLSCEPGHLAAEPTWARGFWAKVDWWSDHCWTWQAYRAESGYGVFNVTGDDPRYAHRLSYELLVGHIPEGLHIDHLCRVRECVNPGHLEAVTPAENSYRSEAPNIVLWRNDVCAYGHALTLENTYFRPDNGHRQCRICIKRRSRTQEAKRRALREAANAVA